MTATHATRMLRMASLAAALLAVGCASVEERYFLDTPTKANVYVAPVKNPEQQLRKVAIMPFKGPSELVGGSVSDLFVTEILRTGRYDLVERSQMSKVLSESELALAGLSAAKAAEVGSMLGSEGVIIGTVDEYSMAQGRRGQYPLVGITARLIDCKTGQVVWSVDLAHKSDQRDLSLPEHARAVVHEMVAGLYRKWRSME